MPYYTEVEKFLAVMRIIMGISVMATQNNCSYCVLLGQYKYLYTYLVINFQKCVKIKFTVLILKYLFCLIKIQIERKTAHFLETIIFTECIKEDCKTE